MHAPPIVVLGAGRSGTTWLAEILAASGLELIFEPLNERQVPEATEFRRTVRFLDATDTTDRWDQLFQKILAGEIRNTWTLRAGTRGDRKLVKFIRANFILEWMLSRFDFLPIFIIRNPFAVVNSLQTENWHIPNSWLEWIIADQRLSRLYLPSLDDHMGRPLRPTEMYSLYWCIQNVVPKRQGLFSRMPVIRFEELYRDPEAIISGLAPRLGIEMNATVREACHRWSFMKGRRADQAGYDPMTAWRSSLTKAEIDTVYRIVRRFDLEEFIGE